MKRQCAYGKGIAMSGTVVDLRSPCPTRYMRIASTIAMLIYLMPGHSKLAHNAPAQRIEWFALFAQLIIQAVGFIAAGIAHGGNRIAAFDRITCLLE